MVIERREAILEELITVKDWVRWGATRFTQEQVFFGHGTDNAWDEALQLLMHVTSLPWDLVSTILDTRLTHDERKQALNFIQDRIDTRKPAAYLTGTGWFCGLPFTVNEHVLVPRSPIAELIDQQFEPWLRLPPERILDLCTGSGCIGIACAYAFPEAWIDLSDISAEALDVAWQNIHQHELDGRVQAIESDLFEHLKNQRYDLIVTNPPYVDAEDIADMPEEFHWEPQIALASGHDGLDFTRRLLKEAHDHLTEEGLLVCEVGNSWPALEALLPEVPFIWPEFSRGGHGVFILSRHQLQQCYDHLSAEFN
ncbi:50S ribosomal protein L3 N(5)-glutamine methyltransferase [Marinibactrum halimedae]|uniref:Ribosomal protein uL3 glutamine methyltransferase n=1 Tax=Marinibactrum halimedae TaxID=1444977 RepID=A0AA37WLS4_9GAMM|nr:50S ribosomal protein L3 N(5)-glutamine methyltransferase [Marinibactrum halimedae]MCD9458695.1 50S ribosomal protein L3 N(5)-glutamine methyltransferase [Marinibactrum halimedae]GLS25938.1 50S ribosomal protein L3 glutamine methyltransferase [Marinibactrum halimedae]